MSRENSSLRNHFLLFVGLGIGVLLIVAGTDFWNRHLREGGLSLAFAAVLAVFFFRRRMLALSLLILSVAIALFGLGAISHRSVVSSIVALAAAAIAYLLVRWDVKKHGARALGDWESLLDNDEKP